LFPFSKEGDYLRERLVDSGWGEDGGALLYSSLTAASG
jgi:hypothetical protein